jgi:hypothetical protein
MKSVTKYAPALLAIVIFLVTNFIQTGLDSDKKELDDKVSQIEKDNQIYLEYQAMARNDINFGQLHLNSAMESTKRGDIDMRKTYLTTVAEHMGRAVNTLSEARDGIHKKDIATSTSTSSGDDMSAFVSQMRQTAAANQLEAFVTTFMATVQKSQEILKDIKEYIGKMGEEKASLKLQLASVNKKEKVVWYITLALNFLIILFSHKLLFAGRKENGVEVAPV